MIDQDKTKQQLIEELAKLRQTVAQWQSVIANMPIFVALVDRAGTIQYLNHTVPGIMLEDVVGKSTYDFLEPSYRENARECIERVFDTGETAFYESVAAGPNGTTAWYETYVGPVKVGDHVVAVTLVGNDIDKQKRAEQERDRIQVILQATIECLPFEFFAIGLDGRYMLQNATLREHYGDALGKRPEDYASDEATLRLWLDNNRRAFAGERVEGEVEARDGGNTRHLYNIISPIRDESKCFGILGVNVDITERKKAEAALQKAHDELEQRVAERTADLLKTNQELEIHRHFAQNATQGFGIADLDGCIMYVNPAMCRLLGEARNEDVVGKHVFDYGQNMTFRKEEFLPNLLREGRWDREGVVRTRSGKIIPVWQSSFIIRDDDGQPAYIATIHTDISERKQAEDALRQSHDELRAIYEGMFDGFIIVDVESKHLLKVNASICRMLGYSEAELLSMSVKDIHPPEEVSVALRTIDARAVGQYKGHINISFLRKDGSIFFVDLVSTLITCGKRLCLAAFIHDVTEKKQAEDALRASETQYRQIFESVTDALLIFDLDGNVVAANPAACSNYGYEREEIIGLSATKLIAPQNQHHFAEAMRQIATRGFFYAESIDARKDGTTFHVEVRGSGFLFQGKPHMLAVVRNVDERKQAQEALQKEHRTLKHLLQSSDHERQTIAYEIHDGLAQYLASAIMQFDVYKAQRQKKPKDAEKAYEAAVTLLSQGHSEARRLIAGIRHPVLDEAGVVEAVAHLINEQNRRKGPKIDFHSLVDFSRLVPLLENAIYRIIQEGMTNACKYSQSSRVRITLLQQKDRLRIEIRDWGIGFDPTNVKEGSYGLAGIRERARLLGGKFRLHSAAGKGTRILIKLPLMERDD
jgi:PAS domain S-box-containing protein